MVGACSKYFYPRGFHFELWSIYFMNLTRVRNFEAMVAQVSHILILFLETLQYNKGIWPGGVSADNYTYISFHFLLREPARPQPLTTCWMSVWSLIAKAFTGLLKRNLCFSTCVSKKPTGWLFISMKWKIWAQRGNFAAARSHVYMFKQARSAIIFHVLWLASSLSESPAISSGQLQCVILKWSEAHLYLV